MGKRNYSGRGRDTRALRREWQARQETLHGLSDGTIVINLPKQDARKDSIERRNKEAYCEADRQAKSGQFANALNVLACRIREVGDSLKLHPSLFMGAVRYARKIEFDELAKNYFERGIKAFPDDSYLLTEGVQLYLSENNLEMAEFYLKKKMALDPHSDVTKGLLRETERRLTHFCNSQSGSYYKVEEYDILVIG